MVKFCIQGIVFALTLSFVACLETQYVAGAAPAWNYIPSNDMYFAKLKEQEQSQKVTIASSGTHRGDTGKSLRVALDSPNEHSNTNGIGEVVRIYYINGELAWEIHFLGGKQHGPTKHFYSNGQLHAQLNFNNGKAHGTLISYYHYGVLKSEEQYENDALVGTSKFYTPLGELKRTVRYENGKQIEESHILASR